MPDDRRHVAIIGMAGVGKTAIGSRLARRLGWDWVDLDELVEQQAGRSVSELFSIEGEAGFRSREAAALIETLRAPGPTVMSTGGGAVLADPNAAALRDGAVVVWLRATEPTIVARLRRSRTKRPLISGDVAAKVATLVAQRSDRYAECADITLDVDGRSIDRCVEAVLEALASHSIEPAGTSTP